jgi:hypothetical protein
MTGMPGPGADPRLGFDSEDMRCVCGGMGTPIDAAEMGGGWWAVTWWTEHASSCRGAAFPERAILVDAEAFARGDYFLPGIEAEQVRVRRPLSPYAVEQLVRRRANGRNGCLACQPDPDYPARWVLCDRHQCHALAAATGQRCQGGAGPDGLCPAHRRRP